MSVLHSELNEFFAILFPFETKNKFINSIILKSVTKQLEIKGGNIIMIIGVPKEIKNNENRVALTPAGVDSYVQVIK